MKSSPNQILLAALLVCTVPEGTFAAGHSLRFHGNGTGDVDRVKIFLDPQRPVDVGGDFTVEFWMKALPGENLGAGFTGNDGWITGNILFDRDVLGTGDHGDYGISLGSGRIAFGVNNGSTGETILGVTTLTNGQWHHIAVTRRAADGQLRVFVDGVLDGEGSGPTGDLSYRDGRPSAETNSDPFLVIGAEKHDAGAAYPSFRGWIDDVRISKTVRYTAGFARPVLAFRPDPDTVALYPLDEGNGNVIHDTSATSGGPSHGMRKVGGVPAGPEWSSDTPFDLGPVAITLQSFVTGLTNPVDIAHAGDGSCWLFIVEQPGRIRIHDGMQLLPTPFLDIGSLLIGSGEQGLLGMTFHPNYQSNGFFYVNYTRTGDGATVIARYTRSLTNAHVADTNSALVLSTIPQPYGNHNGGQLRFGPDGYLYIGLGDGGFGDDPENYAQRLNELLGKMLRLDVDNGTPYAVPPDNPFVNDGDTNTLAEIWASGLRNPWRFSFDRLTGDLFLGDVGQNTIEEISFQAAGTPGGTNFGWRVMEATLCHDNSLFQSNVPCQHPSLTPPIVEYPHSNGDCSIIGGFRYRGRKLPGLVGHYLYGDWCSGRIWSATVDNNGLWTTNLLSDESFQITSFGEDEAGEIYVAAYDTGVIHQIVGADADSDGLPDWWEQAWFGNATNATASSDEDGDGMSNIEEYAAATDPLDPASVLRIIQVEHTSTETRARFQSVFGMKYRVERRDALETDSWTTLADNVPGTGGVVIVTDPSASGLPKRFYRVRMLR